MMLLLLLRQTFLSLLLVCTNFRVGLVHALRPNIVLAGRRNQQQQQQQQQQQHSGRVGSVLFYKSSHDGNAVDNNNNNNNDNDDDALASLVLFQDDSSMTALDPSSKTNAKALLVSAWSAEWQDSFGRNGLVDFCPPLTDSLNCWIVGGNDHDHDDNDDKNNDWLFDWSDKISAQSHKDKQGGGRGGDENATSIMTSRMSLPLDPSLLWTTNDLAKHDNNNNNNNNDGPLSQYDCLLDSGRMDSALQKIVEASSSSSSSSSTVGGVIQVTLMLQQATKMLKEHGIYVVRSNNPNGVMAQAHVQDYLHQVGDILGLQWQFGLDGLTNETQMVSVARKYCTGEMPSFQKLSRVPFSNNNNNNNKKP